MPEGETMHAVEGTGNAGEGRHTDGPHTTAPSYRDMVMNMGDVSFKPEEIVQLETEELCPEVQVEEAHGNIV